MTFAPTIPATAKFALINGRFRLAGLMAVMLLLPWGFAGISAWAWGPAVALAGVLALFQAAALATGASVLSRLHKRFRLAWICFGIALVWAAIQCFLPLSVPPAHPLWAETAAVFDAGTGQSVRTAAVISLSPGSAWGGLLRMMALGLLFFLAFEAGRETRSALLLLRVFLASVVITALYGLMGEFFAPGHVLWIEKIAYRDALTGPFINRNSFATWAGMGLVVACGLALRGMVMAAAGMGPRAGAQARMEWVLAHGWPLVGAIIILTFALILTESRAGMISTALGLASLAGIAAMTGMLRGRALGIVVLAMAALLLAGLFVSGEELAVRLARSGTVGEERGIVWTLALRAIADAPWTGTGLSSFADVARFYRADGEAAVWQRAHSDWLEMILSLGLPGAAVLFAGYLRGFWLVAGGLRRRERDRSMPAMGVVIMLLVAVHALVDFSLQMPAVSFSFAILCGVCAAQSWPARKPS